MARTANGKLSIRAPNPVVSTGQTPGSLGPVLCQASLKAAEVRAPGTERPARDGARSAHFRGQAVVHDPSSKEPLRTHAVWSAPPRASRRVTESARGRVCLVLEERGLPGQ